MTRRTRPSKGLILLAPVLVFAAIAVAGAASASSTANGPLAEKVILFASDGMRPDLMNKYVGQGVMPTYADLLSKGVQGQNGLLQGFPPNTGVGWTTLATGTWPSEHGSTNNTFFRQGDSSFNNRTSFAEPIVQADHIAQAAERAGKKVVSVEWVASRSVVPALQGPVVDFRTFFSNRGIIANYDVPGQPAGANAQGVSYQRTGSVDNQTPLYDVPAVTDASGWTSVPATQGTPKQTQFRLRNTAFPAANNVNRFFDLLLKLAFVHISSAASAHNSPVSDSPSRISFRAIIARTSSRENHCNPITSFVSSISPPCVTLRATKIWNVWLLEPFEG